MDALRLRIRCRALLVLAAVLMTPIKVMGATWQTRNFSVTADHEHVARRVGQQAEEYRRQLAIFWLGEPLPNWSKPCKLRVREGSLGAGGQTTFQFVRGEVLNWDMYVQGTLERILDSVLPHEINHTIFACHFRRPLPRWADEGAATLFEDRSEQLKQLALLNDVINNDRERITLHKLLGMKEYPAGKRPMLILYAQGYALADFLVQQKGRKSYLAFLADGDALGWEESIRKHFDHEGIDALEKNWKGWVLAGMPKLTTPRDQMLAGIADQPENHSAASPAVPVKTAAQTGTARASTADAAGKGTADSSTATIARRSTPPARTAVRSQNPNPLLARNENHVSVQRDARPPAMEIQTNGLVSRNDLPTPNTIDLAGQRLRQPRRASIQAPAPHAGHAVSTQAPAGHAASTTPAVSTSSVMVGQVRGVDQEAFDEYLDAVFSDPTTDPLIDGGSDVVRPDNLEPTAAPVTKPGSSDDAAVSSEFRFDSLYFPTERNVKSGSTPVWAGFPGQKKLF